MGARYIDLLARLERLRSAGVLLGLDRMRAVMAALGQPQRAALTVHIAGTNGKGSTAAMTEAVLRAAGWRTGLYTSPHLARFTERIRIAGAEADGDRLAELAERVAGLNIPLTYFELATALAFLSFAEKGVEVAVLETGLGGRLDATTVCEPVATAITSIGLDHTEVLGGTLAEIAREKAGIAKPGVPLFLGRVPAEADTAIATVATAIGAPVLRYGHDFSAPVTPPGLAGAHQTVNAAVATALARRASEARGRPLAEEAIAAGLAGVTWPGRMEWLGEDLLLDCAHNPEGAVALAEAVGRAAPRRRALVFSAVAGKSVPEMLAALAPRFDFVVATRSSSDRALPAAELAALAAAIDTAPVPRPAVSEVADPLAAVTAARRLVGPGGLVVVAGSIFLVGDVRAAVLGEVRDPVWTSDPAASPASRL